MGEEFVISEDGLREHFEVINNQSIRIKTLARDRECLIDILIDKEGYELKEISKILSEYIDEKGNDGR